VLLYFVIRILRENSSSQDPERRRLNKGGPASNAVSKGVVMKTTDTLEMQQNKVLSPTKFSIADNEEGFPNVDDSYEDGDGNGHDHGEKKTENNFISKELSEEGEQSNHN